MYSIIYKKVLVEKALWENKNFEIGFYLNTNFISRYNLQVNYVETIFSYI